MENEDGTKNQSPVRLCVGYLLPRNKSPQSWRLETAHIISQCLCLRSVTRTQRGPCSESQRAAAKVPPAVSSHGGSACKLTWVLEGSVSLCRRPEGLASFAGCQLRVTLDSFPRGFPQHADLSQPARTTSTASQPTDVITEGTSHLLGDIMLVRASHKPHVDGTIQDREHQEEEITEDRLFFFHCNKTYKTKCTILSILKCTTQCH